MTKARVAWLMAAGLALAGCATPQQTCIAAATRDLGLLDQRIAETRATLARGHAVDREEVIRTRTVLCRSGDEDGPVFDLCEVEYAHLDIRPRAVDLAAERRNLAAMVAQRTGVERAASAAAQRCRAIHPH